MSSFIKKTTFFFKRKLNLPLVLIGAFFVCILMLNEDASFSQSMEYEQEIVRLRQMIKESNDSAEYYRARRLAIERGDDELEYLAREQYHMKRPSEDVFLLVSTAK